MSESVTWGGSICVFLKYIASLDSTWGAYGRTSVYDNKQLYNQELVRLYNDKEYYRQGHNVWERLSLFNFCETWSILQLQI